ncbi:transmembrane protein 236 isoform X1 [Ictidomys tridecemlineatus]|uniref:transmembrane protein 236 n=1 Tax=Ictidomys tridecemlineatus TaxID=43179 RepID=UPI00025D9FDD|nr:transmembrane protein 236 [Ictidomys tridecemlineatus]
MASGKLIKLIVFELLEFAAFSVPTLVVMEQFATAYQRTRNASEPTHYWLIVSCSIAYVASVTLLIWVPIKVILHKKRHLYKKITGWRPVLMMCVVLTTLPSFSFSIAVTEVQKNINGSADLLPDALPDLPVSLVLLSLILVDIIEKIRIYPLRGSEESNEDGHIHTTSLQQIKTVTEQVRQNEVSPASPQGANSIHVSRPLGAVTQRRVPVLVGPQEPSFDSGILRTMSRRDVRAEVFLWSFLLWSDTVEMLRVAGHSAVYKSGWLYPVYIFSFISLLRIIFTPKNPLLNSLGILLQDLPFVFVRLSLIIVLGTITPILGLCKNVLVTLSYVYFNYLTKLRVFSTFEASPF